MILFEEGIGKLKNISHNEFEKIIHNLPKDWDYSFTIIYESSLGKDYDKYNVKLFRKKKI